MNLGGMCLGMVEAEHYLLENVYLAGNFTILLKSFPKPAGPPVSSSTNPQDSSSIPFLLYLVSFQIVILELFPSTKLLLN